ncbi:MAG: hypothetical protein LBC85_06020 [Fibromonadaceae bacterium]|nr:hypothetical protein [Fibromonadaceae bacterium]
MDLNLQFFLETVKGVGSLFYIPVLIWISYFFWCRFLDYPAALEKIIRNGKVWPYLPIYWKGKKKGAIRAVSLLLFWAGNLLGAAAMLYFFDYAASMAIGLGLSFFIGMKISQLSTKEIIRLQQNMYFQIYTQLANHALSKGDEVSDSELLSKAQWQHHNDLRQADKRGRLRSFLKGEAML